MDSTQNRKFTLFLPILLGLFCLAGSAESNEPPNNKEVEQRSRETPDFGQLTLMKEKLTENYIDLKRSLEDIFDPETIKATLDDVEERLITLTRRLEGLIESNNATYEQLVNLRRDLRRERNSLQRVLTPINNSINELHNLFRDWSRENEKWTSLKHLIEEEATVLTVQSTIKSALEEISSAQVLISSKLDSSVKAEVKGRELRSKTYSMLGEIKDAISRRRTFLPPGDTAGMFSISYWGQFGPNLWSEMQQGIRDIPWTDQQFIVEEGWITFFKILIAMVIALLIIYFRPSLKGKKHEESITHRPFSLGFVVGIFFFRALDPTLSPVPSLVINAIGWIAFARLAGFFTNKTSSRWMIYGVALTLILIQLFSVVRIPLPLYRLFILTLSTIGGISALKAAKNAKDDGDSLLQSLGLTIVGGLLLFTALDEFLGYTDVARALFTSIFSTIGVFLVVWFCFNLTEDLIQWVVKDSPVKSSYLFKTHGSSIIENAVWIVYLILALSLVLYLLVGWEVFDSPREGLEKILSYGVSAGELEITIGTLLNALLMLYGSFLSSWWVQSVLMGNVFPMMKVPPSVGMSIARLTHYAIIFFGVILALLALGLSLNNLTIMGGAIGIGVGFGLQEIVKNIAAGIIVLFERPIKLGDMIEFEGSPCRVERIGLRSTIIRTTDGIKKIIPNNDLIATSVTNWTHNRKRMRLRIPVTVAYESDIPQVMKVIKKCAEDNDLVLDNPEPNVLFLTFGDSSLNFEMRIWINDVKDRRRVQSEINQDLERRLREANIKVPFPQLDVHIQSPEHILDIESGNH